MIAEVGMKKGVEMRETNKELIMTDDLPLLFEALNHEDDETREIAVRRIGYSRDPTGIPYLINHLLDPNPDVQSEINSALNRLGTPAEIELLKTLNNETNPELQAAAAEALGKFGTRVTIGALCEAIKSEHVPVRHAAINSLGRIGIVNPEIENALIECLDDRESVVVKTALRAIGSLKCDRAVARLIEFINSSDAGVRYNSIVALGNLQNMHAVMPLIQAMQNSDDYHFHVQVIDALTSIKDPLAIDPLIEMLSEEANNPMDRYHGGLRCKSSHIRHALTAIGEPAVKPLIEMIRKESTKMPKPDIQRRICWDNQIFSDIRYVLADIGSPAVEALIDLIQDNNWVVRKFACVTLGDISDKTAITTLITTVTKDPSSDVRDEAGRSLMNFPAGDVFDPLFGEIQKGVAPYLDEAKGVIQCITKDSVGNLRDSLFCDDAAKSSATESIYRNVIACSTAISKEDSLSGRRVMTRRRRRRGFPA